MEQELESNVNKKWFSGIATHAIKIIVGAIILAALGGAGTAFAFYYRTSNDIKILKKDQKDNTDAIQSVNKHISSINDKLGNTNTTTAVSDEKIKGLEKTLMMLQENQLNIQKNQTDILKMLSDIKRGR